MTTWSEIITAAMTIINDVRWREQLEISPAQFYRAKSLFVKEAYPMLNRPTELLEYLTESVTEPSYTSYSWTSDEQSLVSTTAVNTGAINYDLCSCVAVSQNDAGDVSYTPYADVQYDKTTGTVTFPVQDATDLVYELDFYTDGTFADLSDSQMRLFSKAIAYIWDERFNRDYLTDVMKIKDSSFATANESQYMRDKQARQDKNKQAFTDELRAYEQTCAYNRTNVSRKTTLL